MRHPKRRRGQRDRRERADPLRYEAEVLPGLAPFACAELATIGAHDPAPTGAADRADAVGFAFAGAPGALQRLRTVTSVQRVLAFDVPRPKALLGDAHLRRLGEELRTIVRAAPEPFHAVRLEAAGADSPTMRRLRAACADATGLPDDPDDGDLRIRVRPAPDGRGWQVLPRLTARPLSARAWRVRNRPGGLNACVAAAAWRLVGHDPRQRVWNPMCGSGTLAIERAALGPAARLLCSDLDPGALDAAEANARAAGLAARRAAPPDVRNDAAGNGGASGGASGGANGAPLELLRGDATETAPAGAFDACVCDPPWGDAVGDVRTLGALYDGLLRVAARAVVPGGRLLVVTHALRAWERAESRQADAWRPLRSVRVFHGGHRPALRLLERTSRPDPRDGDGTPGRPSGARSG